MFCRHAKFQEIQKCHYEAVKITFGYINRATYLGLWHSKLIPADVMCVADSDLEECIVDRKFTSRICAFVGNLLPNPSKYPYIEHLHQ